ncbi:MAG: outer membrane lipoprotein-sorting protein [Myxococcota bacterium]|jgi:outer membrane lipoprotein-sorting protein
MSHLIPLALALLVAGTPVAEPPLPTAKDITSHMDRLYRADSSYARLVMDIKTTHFERSLELESWSRGKDQSVAVIRKPAREAGTATLRNKDGMWNYAPRADRLMRVPTALLADSWMGSHLTNDDLMQESSWEDDYDSTVRWFDNKGTRELQLVSIPKKDAAVVYSKVVMALNPEGLVPLRTEYYDGDEVVRTFLYEEPRKFGDQMIPTVMRIVPVDKPEERTVVTYKELKFDIKVSDSLFTARGLRKAARK